MVNTNLMILSSTLMSLNLRKTLQHQTQSNLRLTHPPLFLNTVPCFYFCLNDPNIDSIFNQICIVHNNRKIFQLSKCLLLDVFPQVI